MSFLDDARTGELWAKVKAALSTKQSKLTGSAGQVVGFGADGGAQAVQGWSNPNLLINCYFADPWNQRGLTEYSASGYTIDMWRIWADAAVTVEDDGITLAANSRIFQYFEDTDILRGKLLTLSVLTADHSLWTWTVEMPTADITLYSPANSSYELSLFNGSIFTGVSIKAKSSKKLTAAKLELGSHQTLARQDASGNWVLNDPPPNKALELLKCQRYYQVFSSADMRPTKAVDFRPPMRVEPALRTIEINGVTFYTADANL